LTKCTQKVISEKPNIEGLPFFQAKSLLFAHIIFLNICIFDVKLQGEDLENSSFQAL
jgi:hypothetical protein